MVFSKTFSYDKHYLWRTIRTAIHSYLLCRLKKHLNLLCRQGIGIETKRQAMNWRIENGMMGIRENVLHLPDIRACHQFVSGDLV